LLGAVEANAPALQIKKLIDDTPLSMSLSLPSTERSAWEAAIAGQATRFMPMEEVRVFSQAYAAAADLQGTAIAATSGSMAFAHKAISWGVDHRLGRSDPVALIHILAQWRHSSALFMNANREASAAMATALAWPDKPPVSPAAASASSTVAAPAAPSASAAAVR
jgi:hypothetical protein